MNPIPGIFITSAVDFSATIIDPATGTSGRALDYVYNCQPGGWLRARIETHRRLSEAVYVDDDLVVLLDGYVSEIVGEKFLAKYAAKDIAQSYAASGLDFISRLRGSYSCFIYDERDDVAYLFNDRRASRPMFYRRTPAGEIIFAPEVSRLSQPTDAVDAAAACEFLLLGSYFVDDTIISAIKKLPQASLVRLNRGEVAWGRYWQHTFAPAAQQRTEQALIEECDALISQATRRIIRSVEEPALFLSGGTDSRVLLGSILALSEDIPAVCYGMQLGDDFAIANVLAKENKLRCEAFELPERPGLSAYVDAALASDGRAETIDAPTMGSVFGTISGRYRSFINGDECFGWQAIVNNRRHAFERVGILTLAHAVYLDDWILPSCRGSIQETLEERRAGLVAAANVRHPNNLKDWLYYHTRLGNMLNAFTGNKLRYLEQARPLVDEDVVDFVAHLPRNMADDKYLLRQLLRAKYPHLLKTPLASKDSIPDASTYRKLFSSDARFSDFVHEKLIKDFDDRLGSILHIERVQAVLNALAEGRSLHPSNRKRWAHLPGMWRLSARIRQNWVSPVVLVMRLLQLNIYLRNLAGLHASPAAQGAE